MEIDATKPLVSICVPVYNVAPYIEQCVRTLFEQTYPNLEFVFVNDASTDDSMTVLRRVAEEYPSACVRYVENDHNHGLAYTRRRSIESATGEYICCVDSDDWVERDMVDRMVAVAHSGHAKMVECGYTMHKQDGLELVRPICPESFDDVICDRVRNNIWGKLYHRSLFDDPAVFAPEGLDYMEDRHLLTRLRYAVRQPALLDEPLYHYRGARTGSVATSKGRRHFECLVTFNNELEQWLRAKGCYPQYQPMVDRTKVLHKLMFMFECTQPDVCRRYASLYKEEERRYRSTLPRGYRVVSYLVALRCRWLLAAYRCLYLKMARS